MIFTRFISAALITILALGGLPDATLAQSTASIPTALTETYGQWVVRCVTPQTADGASPAALICQMSQELRQEKSGKRILALSVQPKADISEASLRLIVPFGLLLSEGVKVAVDESALLEVGFRTCLPAGCIVATDMTADQMGKLAAGNVAVVMMRDVNNQELSISVSLSGFTAAWNRLKDF
jgi:invasion protein IalB